MNPDRITAERLEEARQRVSEMLAAAAALGAEIGPEEISRVTLVPIHPVGEYIAAMLANLAHVGCIVKDTAVFVLAVVKS